MRIILTLSCFCWIVYACNPNAPISANHAQTDTLSYEQQIVNKSYNGCEPDSDNCTYIEYLFPLFVNAHQALSDSLTQCMLDMIGGKHNIQQSIYLLVDSFLTDYDNIRKSNPEDTRTWEKQAVINVVSQSREWVCLSYSEYSFTGGAHGNSFTVYKVLSKKNGQQLLLTDLYTPQQIQQLQAAAEQEFRRQFELSATANLDSAGFWFGENGFQFGKSFYPTDSSITFIYNQYEIAPYVMGAIELTVPNNRFL